jgi:hypothetical protein
MWTFYMDFLLFGTTASSIETAVSGTPSMGVQKAKPYYYLAFHLQYAPGRYFCQ